MSDDVTKSINIEFRDKGVSELITSMAKVDQKYDSLIQKIDEAARAGKISGTAREAASKAVVRELDREIASQVKLTSAVGESEKASQKYRNVQTTVTQAIKDGESIRDRELSQLKAQIQAREELAKTLGGRNYQNASTSMDAMIGAQDEAGRRFSAGLQSRLQDEQKAQAHAAKAAADTDKHMRAQVQTWREMQTATTNAASSLPRLRYALYDVSTTAAVTGAALLGLATATAMTSIRMDRQFADVLRTTELYMEGTGEEAKQLRADFNALFASMPASWADLTEIGTLAGQLGIASENVAEFTKLVTMFASTTDVSVEQSATAFGRLSELLSVNANEYSNLGSSILAVGVASVATESQIINTTTQLASMGSYAGFSADEVVGLSSALASLGTQPELSRGVITRLFVNISNAIADGGQRLEAFGRTARMSGEDFARAWGNDAAGTFQALISGLGEVESQGGNAVQVLQDMGITASRDIPTILRLAQNHELLAEQMGIAAQGYADNNALQDQYGVVAETVAEKLTVLRNNVQLFVGALGDSSGALAPLIDLLTKFVQVATDLVSRPITSTVLGIVGALAALVGVALLATGAMAQFGASAAALKTARTDLIALAIELGVVKTQAEAASMSFAKLSAATMAAAGGTKVLTNSLRALKLATVIGGVLVAAELIYEAFNRANDSTLKFTGDIQGLQDALSQDTANVIAGTSVALNEFTVGADRTSDSSRQLAEVWGGSADGLPSLKSGIDSVSDSLKEQTVYVSDLTKEWLANQIVTGAIGSELIDKFSDVEFILADMGTNLSDALSAALTPDVSDDVDFEGYFNSIEQQLAAHYNTLESLQHSEPIYSLFPSNAEYQQAMSQWYEQIDATSVAIRELENTRAAATGVRDIFTGLYGEVSDAFDAASAVKAVADALGVSEFEAYSGIVDQAISDSLGFLEATLSLESSISSLGKSLAEGGNDWSEFSEAGRDNLGALASVMNQLQATSSTPDELASKFQALFEFLVNGGYASSEQLYVLRQAIFSLTGNKGIQAASMDFSSFFNGFNTGAKTATSRAKSAQREVRTLTDYVSDLSKVMGAAFDFRFGFQESLDDTITSFRDIEQAFEDARNRVRDLTLAIQEYQAQISGINSDINILQYHLSIAEEYDDELRAAAIRAELEEQNAKLAKTQADLTDAQKDYTKAVEKATPDLESNTEGAIDQRKAVLDLVESYKDQIAAYAATGASQQQISAYTRQLKTGFEDQMRTLGYAEASIRKYSVAFDDFRTIVDRVPRNLTISVNADPAIRALDEYNAKLRQVQGTVSGGGFSPVINDSALARSATALRLYTDLMRMQSEAAGYAKSGSAIPPKLTNDIGRIANQLKTGSYAEGGYTGSGGKYEVAGVVHKGEYVIPARQVNQATGLPYADAFSRLSRGVQAPTPSYAQGGYVGGGHVQGGLSASDIQMLREMVSFQLNIDGKMVARVTGAQNIQDNRLGAA